jgi:hypothetical protein
MERSQSPFGMTVGREVLCLQVVLLRAFIRVLCSSDWKALNEQCGERRGQEAIQEASKGLVSVSHGPPSRSSREESWVVLYL